MATPLAPDAAMLRRKQTRRQRVALIVLLLVGGLIALAAYIGTQHQRAADPDNASVGDCMARSGSTDMKRVSCTDGSAAFVVAGKVENKTEADLGISSGDICKPFPAAKSAFWRGEIGKKGYILCLAPR
jgi:hypothetical protein